MDAVAIGCQEEQGIVVMAFAGNRTAAARKICADYQEDVSGQVMALTPERATQIALKLVEMAQKAARIRERG